VVGRAGGWSAPERAEVGQERSGGDRSGDARGSVVGAHRWWAVRPSLPPYLRTTLRGMVSREMSVWRRPVPRSWLECREEGQALSEYVLASAVVVIVAAFWFVVLSNAIGAWHEALLRAVQS
jgi:hypothetical protein